MRNNAMEVAQHLLVKLYDIGQVAVDGGPETSRQGREGGEHGNIDLNNLLEGPQRSKVDIV